jgi:hypothetical protein
MNQETKQVGYHFETVWRNGHAGCRHVPLVNRLCRKRTGPHRPGLDVACITTLEGLHTLRETWQRLEQADGRNTTAFQSYDWCAAWADAFVPSRRQNRAVHRHASAPGRTRLHPARHDLHRRRAAHLPGAVATLCPVLGHPVPPELAHPAVLDANSMTRSRPWPALMSSTCAMCAKTALPTSLPPATCSPPVTAKTAPAMELSAFASEQDYLARYTKVQRRRRKKIANAIEKLGPLSFTSHTRSESRSTTCWTTSSVTSRAGSPNVACIPRR